VQDKLYAQQAEQFLLIAYGDERQRAHAVRWLGWIAGNMRTSELAWWEIPDWVPPKQIRFIRRFAVCAVLAVDIIAVIAATSWVWAIFCLLIAAIANVSGGRGKSRSVAVRRNPPCATVPHWPRGLMLVVLLLFAVAGIGLVFLPVLLSTWAVPAQKRPGTVSYRADRLSSVLYGLACAPFGAFVGVLAFAPAYGSPGWVVGTLLSALTAVVGFWAVRGSSYSLLKLAELALAAKWRERVAFLRLLEEAEHHGVVLRTSTGYVFRDNVLQAYLAAEGKASSVGRERKHAPGAARTGSHLKVTQAAAWFDRFKIAHRVLLMRLLRRMLAQPAPGKAPQHRLLSAVSGGLTKSRIDRIAFDFGAGAAIAVLAGYLLSAIPAGTGLATEIICALLFPLLGLLAASVAGKALLRATAGVSRRGAVYVPLLARKARIGAAVVVIAAGAILVAEAGTFLANTLAFLLPPAFVTACGLWLCALAFRRWHASASKWLNRVPDQVAIATSAAALLVAADRYLLTAQWAMVLLFPIAIGGSLRLWIVMRKAGRLIIRAGADISLSLLLGCELVLFLIWLGNVLGMPRSEVDLIRTRLGSAGAYASIYDGGRLWVGIYATLAAASVAFALYPGRLKTLIKWFNRLQLPQVVTVVQRVVTGVYIGILTIVFVGVTAPTALTPALQRQLKTTYVVALQRELKTEAEISAYNEIREEINKLASPGAVTVLGYLIQAIHQDAHQPADSRSATGTEKVLAYRVGEDQAAALNLPSPPSLAPTGPAVTDPADFGRPAHDARDLGKLATQTATAENAGGQAKQHLKVAFELTVAAVANAVPIPNISKNEVTQILTQYISGLVDDSKVTGAFEDWLEHIPRRKAPPSAETLVVPDPSNLENVAQHDLNHEAAVQGVAVLPDVSSAVLSPAASIAQIDRAAIDDAVDNASQSQAVQETGTCPDCIGFGDKGGGSHDNHDENPVPDIHVGD
jgi:hypothetical protein